MSGNLWMFSDMLDDEDIEMLKRDYITYYQGADYYGLGLKVFTRMAHEAGAVYKIGKKVLIRRSIFEEYLRQQCKSNDRENRLSLYESDKEIMIEEEDDMMRQGVLIPDLQSGRMDIRFGLEDYYGGLHCGTTMDVKINGTWIPTRIEMGDDWYLVGVKTKSLLGLTVRI